MKLLLDTHVLLWWLEDNPRLRPRVRAIIADERNTVMVSAASFWELSVKARKGKIDMSGPSTWRQAVAEGFSILEITDEHLNLFEALPMIAGHGDPFDLLILAQAQADEAALVTADRHMAAYGVRLIGVA